jgi:hypothetical protein
VHIEPLLLKSDYTGQNVSWAGKVHKASWLLHKFLHARVISRKPRAQQSLERLDHRLAAHHYASITILKQCKLNEKINTTLVPQRWFCQS